MTVNQLVQFVDDGPCFGISLGRIVVDDRIKSISKLTLLLFYFLYMELSEQVNEEKLIDRVPINIVLGN